MKAYVLELEKITSTKYLIGSVFSNTLFSRYLVLL